MPGEGSVTYRQYFRQTLDKRDGVPDFLIKEAEAKLAPPDTQPVFDAAKKARFGYEILEWVGIQWAIFIDLCGQRRSSQNMQPLLFTDIDAYARLNSLEFHTLELHNILAMDEVYLSFVREQTEKMLKEAQKGK